MHTFIIQKYKIIRQTKKITIS